MMYAFRNRHSSLTDLSEPICFGTLLAMLLVLSQVSIPETPKTGDVTAWFGWVVTLLVVVIVAVVVHLRAAGQAAEKMASLQTEKMENVFKTMIDKLDSRHEDAVEEGRSDRTANVEGHRQITEALGEVSKGQIAMTHEIVSLRTEVIRAHSGGPR